MLTQWRSRVDNATLSIVRLVVRSNVILVVTLWPRLSVRDLVVVQSVSLAIYLDFDSTVIHEELVFFLKSWESLLDDAGVVGVFYIDTDHLCEKLWVLMLAKFW